MDDAALKAEIAASFGTPALVVDLDVVDRNVARTQALCDAAGVANRPHVKTHKSPLLARRQVAAGAKGIAVQKLGEAEVMAEELIVPPCLCRGTVCSIRSACQ